MGLSLLPGALCNIPVHGRDTSSPPQKMDAKQVNRTAAIASGISVGVLFLIIGLVALISTIKRKRQEPAEAAAEGDIELGQQAPTNTGHPSMDTIPLNDVPPEPIRSTPPSTWNKFANLIAKKQSPEPILPVSNPPFCAPTTAATPPDTSERNKHIPAKFMVNRVPLWEF